jgi:hypothetical protein
VVQRAPNPDGLSPAEREQRRLAALKRWSRQDPGPFMERVREGQIQKWRHEVIAEAGAPELPEAEILRRIDVKRRAHQSKMTLAALKARKAAP